MGEYTQCNYCSFNRIKKSAKDRGLKVTKLLGDFGLGGFDVFVHPKDVMIDTGNKEQRDKYFVGWMMEIGDHCEC